MPVTPTYPGVYIEEIPSGVRTITGVATSITAFIGRALRGPVDKARTINNYGDFERIFGGLWAESTLGYAVRDFYLNGGGQAIIVRLYREEVTADDPPVPVVSKSKLVVGGFKLEAVYKGAWGMNLRATIDTDVPKVVAERMKLDQTDLFNLAVQDISPGGITEQFRNLSVKDSPRCINNVLKAESKLVRCDGEWPPPSGLPAIAAADDDVSKAESEAKEPLAAAKKKLMAAKKELAEAKKKLADAKAADPLDADAVTDAEKVVTDAKKVVTDAKTAVTNAETAITKAKKAMKASNGALLTLADFVPPYAQRDKKGLYALEHADLFNLLCIPPYLLNKDVDESLIATAAAYCEDRRAMLLIDPPSDWGNKTTAKEQFTDPNQDNIGTRSKNAALFFPRLTQPNPLRDNQKEDFAPCGAVAGVFARTDTERGVWKAPAGLSATLVGVPQLSVPLTDAENGELNPLGINCLRAMPAAGRVIWGTRTLQGDDRLASEWKYIPVRRLALFIEESLFRGTQWVVFEPNDEPLWAQIRLNVGAFMHNLFRQGAFQGQSPKAAYLVKCDKETTTQNDINLGIVNIVVGFAPLKPAEFVIIKIQQLAGQIEA